MPGQEQAGLVQWKSAYRGRELFFTSADAPERDRALLRFDQPVVEGKGAHRNAFCFDNEADCRRAFAMLRVHS